MKISGGYKQRDVQTPLTWRHQDWIDTWKKKHNSNWFTPRPTSRRRVRRNPVSDSGSAVVAKRKREEEEKERRREREGEGQMKLRSGTILRPYKESDSDSDSDSIPPWDDGYDSCKSRRLLVFQTADSPCAL